MARCNLLTRCPTVIVLVAIFCVVIGYNHMAEESLRANTRTAALSGMAGCSSSSKEKPATGADPAKVKECNEMVDTMLLWNETQKESIKEVGCSKYPDKEIEHMKEEKPRMCKEACKDSGLENETCDKKDMDKVTTHTLICTMKKACKEACKDSGLENETCDKEDMDEVTTHTRKCMNAKAMMKEACKTACKDSGLNNEACDNKDIEVVKDHTRKCTEEKVKAKCTTKFVDADHAPGNGETRCGKGDVVKTSQRCKGLKCDESDKSACCEPAEEPASSS